MDTITFASDAPDAELLPIDELADCAAAALAHNGKTILSYGSGAGYTPLRELIAEWFGVHPIRVVLTNGWLQGLDLLAAELLPGDTAAIEYPSDDRVTKLLLRNGASLMYVAGDYDGFSADDLEYQLTQHTRLRRIVVNPDFANPTGRAMSLERRRRLIQLVARYGDGDFQLIEDGSYELTRYEGERIASLFELSGKRTIYSSSFSATIAPGLRTGWLILPDRLAQAVARRANDTYITPALLGQATAFEFIRRGGLEPHLQRLRATLRGRRDTILASLTEHFPEARWSIPEGGYFVWLELPDGSDGNEVLAAAQGVTAVAGTAFASMAHFLRLSYSSVDVERIPVGIERLAVALRGG